MLHVDNITERRRLRRHVSLWRIFAILSLIAAISAFILASQSESGKYGGFRDHIARIHIDGFISGDAQTLKLLKDLRTTKRVKAVIMHIDSPGGTTAGSEALYEAILELGEKKPVTAVMGTVAASGGYITALASDHVVARGNTITGSIGVIFQWAEVRSLLDKLGIRMQEVKSGKLKAEPSMFSPLDDEVRQVTEEMIQDSFRWFVGLVEARRPLSKDQALKVSDGRVYTGRQALKEKLIDAIGGENEARDWLTKEKKLSEKLKIVDWAASSRTDNLSLGARMLHAGLVWIGQERLAASLLTSFVPIRPEVDGLLSIWHPLL